MKMISFFLMTVLMALAGHGADERALDAGLATGPAKRNLIRFVSQEPGPSTLWILNPFVLEVETGGSSNLLFQVSTNLREWTPTFNVFTRLTSFRFVDHSTSPTQPWRFYRASSETESITDKLAAWTGLGFSKYTFRQQMVCGCDPAILTGTVTVEKGKVVDVTDVTAFGDPGVPVPNPDLSRFNSIEGLFDLIQSQMRNADVFAVQIDSNMHFPAHIEIDYYVQFVDDEEEYHASDLHALPTR